MSYQYHLPTSQFSGYPFNGLPCPLSLQDYQKTLNNLLNNLLTTILISNKQKIVELQKQLQASPFNTLPIINWQTDQLTQALLTTNSDDSLLENFNQLFANLHLLEMTLHHVITSWLNQQNMWDGICLSIAPPAIWQTTYQELQGLLCDVNHLHCHLTRLLCQHHDLPIWAEARNKLKIITEASGERKYFYKPDCHSGYELRQIFNEFMNYCDFFSSPESFKESFFFQSQIIKLLAKPTGAHLIKKLNRELSNNKKIQLVCGRDYCTIPDYLESPGTFKNTDNPYKIKPGTGATNAALHIPYYHTSNMANLYLYPNFSFTARYNANRFKTIQIFQLPIFIIIAHELRHIASFLKGKSAPLGCQFQHWKDIYELFDNFEEYRTMRYAVCCEKVISTDFELPTRITHRETKNLSDAIQLVRKGYFLLKISDLEIDFTITRTPEIEAPIRMTESIPAMPSNTPTFNTTMTPITNKPKIVIGSQGGAFKKIER